MVQVGNISLYVEDHGSGKPVLLLHGWPDSAYLWRNQIPFLVDNGFHAIAPDLRGFGRSDRPEGVAAYSLQNVVGDVVGILDGLGIGEADIVGHDWGAAVAWFLAAAYPGRVHKLVVLSVPHPLAPRTLRQREMAWYQLFFQFEGIAEAWLQHDHWALFREVLRGNGDVAAFRASLIAFLCRRQPSRTLAATSSVQPNFLSAITSDSSSVGACASRAKGRCGNARELYP